MPSRRTNIGSVTAATLVPPFNRAGSRARRAEMAHRGCLPFMASVFRGQAHDRSGPRLRTPCRDLGRACPMRCPPRLPGLHTLFHGPWCFWRLPGVVANCGCSSIARRSKDDWARHENAETHARDTRRNAVGIGFAGTGETAKRRLATRQKLTRKRDFYRVIGIGAAQIKAVHVAIFGKAGPSATPIQPKNVAVRPSHWRATGQKSERRGNRRRRVQRSPARRVQSFCRSSQTPIRPAMDPPTYRPACSKTP